jgi:hypothetical protein
MTVAATVSGSRAAIGANEMPVPSGSGIKTIFSFFRLMHLLVFFSHWYLTRWFLTPLVQRPLSRPYPPLPLSRPRWLPKYQGTPNRVAIINSINAVKSSGTTMPVALLRRKQKKRSRQGIKTSNHDSTVSGIDTAFWKSVTLPSGKPKYDTS